MDDSKYFCLTRSVPVHGGQTIDVTYTNDPAEVQRVIEMYKEWIATGEEKFLGLDFEYTSHKIEADKKIAVVQLALRQHVLVYHHSSGDWWQSPALADFFRYGGVKLASVDTTHDKTVFANTWSYTIPHGNYEDIQDLYYDVYKIRKAGMANMAQKLIHPWYKEMKKVDYTFHLKWDKKKLDREHLIYAAIDGFVALELYRVLKPMSDAIKNSRKTSKDAESSRANKRCRWA